jgi:predicted ArsR family transcriptional regulator
VHTVRKQILEILKERGAATVADLAEALEMAPVSVRHHLDILQGDNLICVGRVERNGAVGRPQQHYVLTEQAAAYFPNNFAALAAGLVQQMKLMLPPDQVKLAFQALAQNLAREAGPDQLHQLPLPERLTQVAAYLSERGYLARWVQDHGETDSFFLYKYNCPYRGISGDHPELCTMDQLLIDELVGEPCARVQWAAENGTCCAYQVGGLRQETLRPEIRRQEIQLVAA